MCVDPSGNMPGWLKNTLKIVVTIAVVALKVGNGGMGKLANDFYEEAGYDLMSNLIEQGYGFIIGTVF